MKKVLIASMLVFAFCHAALAHTGYIYGVILDSAGKPLVNASVWATGDHRDYKETTTNSKGEFKLIMLKDVNYSLEVHAEAFYPLDCRPVNSRTMGKIQINNGGSRRSS